MLMDGRGCSLAVGIRARKGDDMYGIMAVTDCREGGDGDRHEDSSEDG